MTAVGDRPVKRWPIALKAALLTTVIGPLAGALCVGVVLLSGVIVSSMTGGVQLGESPTLLGIVRDLVQSVLGLLYLSYFFGLLPAAAAGLLVAAYFLRTGRHPGRYALLVGGLAPPLCLLAIGAIAMHQFVDGEDLKNDLSLAAAAALLGITAAFVTSRLIGYLLRRDFARVRACSDRHIPPP